MRTRRPWQRGVVILLMAPLAALQAAELKLATVFSDHMVLQRDKPVPVWGWADPGERVRVEFAGQKKTATADAAGKWIVKLDPVPAGAEPGIMVIQSERPNRELQVADILVGEVWLGSGQSNMAMLGGAGTRLRDGEDRGELAADPHVQGGIRRRGDTAARRQGQVGGLFPGYGRVLFRDAVLLRPRCTAASMFLLV